MRIAKSDRRSLFVLLFAATFSCSAGGTVAPPSDQSVRAMLTGIASDLARVGPIAWLRYFDDDSRFMMANDGRLQFDGIDSARGFLTGFAKNISHLELTWSNTRIDPLTPRLASVASSYKEVITDSTGHISQVEGYFTGLAILTPTGWRLRNAHWSSALTPN